jgi:hypothetical protein
VVGVVVVEAPVGASNRKGVAIGGKRERERFKSRRMGEATTPVLVREIDGRRPGGGDCGGLLAGAL